MDFSEIKGQDHVKRALEVALTGGHSVLLIGPPGYGKTTLIQTLNELTNKEIISYDDIQYLRNGVTEAKQDLDDGKQIFITIHPCPCGYFGTTIKSCSCDTEMIHNYRVRHTPGAILDRIDIIIEVPVIRFKEMSTTRKGESSEIVKERIDIGIKYLPKVKDAKDESTIRLLESAVDRLGLSMRQYVNILSIAKTIAALDQCAIVEARHIAEAIQYRGQ